MQQSVVKETVGAGYFAIAERADAGRAGNSTSAINGVRQTASQTTRLPVVLNETAARRLFRKWNAIGKRVRDDKQSYEVVGVVRDLKNGIGISQSMVYLPLTPRDFARPPAGGITILVRSDAGADALSGIRNEIASIDPNLNLLQCANAERLPGSQPRPPCGSPRKPTAESECSAWYWPPSGSPESQPTRLRNGARRSPSARRWAQRSAQVLRLVLREGAALVSAGTVLGFLGAIALAKVLSALANIFVDALRVGTSDLRLLVGAPLLLAAVAMLACYVPARRSAQIDPLQALREE